MLFWFALLGALYIVALIAFWSLCRMSATRPRPWTLSPEEEAEFMEIPDSAHRDTPMAVLSMGAGRALGV